jgi:hypothetical protein
MISLIIEIITLQKIRDTRELTEKERNNLSFLRSVLSQKLQEFKLNEFLAILYKEDLAQEELNEIKKILDEKIADIRILLSIYTAIKSEIFEKVLEEYLIQNPIISKPKTPVPTPNYNINFVKDYSFLK